LWRRVNIYIYIYIYIYICTNFITRAERSAQSTILDLFFLVTLATLNKQKYKNLKHRKNLWSSLYINVVLWRQKYWPENKRFYRSNLNFSRLGLSQYTEWGRLETDVHKSQMCFIEEVYSRTYKVRRFRKIPNWKSIVAMSIKRLSHKHTVPFQTPYTASCPSLHTSRTLIILLCVSLHPLSVMA